MTAGRREHTSSALQAWVRALAMIAPIGTQSDITLPVLMARLGARHAHAPALLSAHSTLSYQALADSISRYARWGRAQGWGAGDVIGLLMRNCPEYLAIWLGLTRAGISVALINTHLRAAALAHSINIVQPRAMLVGEGLFEAIEGVRPLVGHAVNWWTHGADAHPLPRADLAAAQLPTAELTVQECAAPPLDARALLIYTSGTTGLPKAANVSHYRLMQWSHWFAGLMDTQPHDRMYDCLPMYHSIGGVVATGAVLVSGGAVVLREHFSAREFWRDVVQERCTLFQYIGELCRYLLAAPTDADEHRHQLRLCCGNGLRAEIWEAFRDRFQIPHILEYYASTEGNFSLYNCEERPGAIGRIPAFLSHRLRIALIKHDVQGGFPLRDAAGHCQRVQVNEIGEAIGEIGADGSGRFEGYADPGASEQKILRDVFTAGDAWYRTGDLMREDSLGFFYFVDRVGDTFRWKGENVSTSEVTAAIERCAQVREVAVYGVTVPGADGRAGMATLVVEPGFDLGALRRSLGEALPAYARPVFLRLAPALALTGTFKLDKRDLLREGYDPTKVSDSLYMDDPASQSYVPLDTARYEQLRGGADAALSCSDGFSVG